MLNTGLLMRKPGESEYGRYRRFLIANHTLILKLAKKVNKYDSNSKYRLSKFAVLLETRFIEKNKIKKSINTIPLKSNYRPTKCCPSCMKIGFHSFVFDYKWLEQCPVHKEDLITTCPDCNAQWPTYSELATKKCLTCGPKINFFKLPNKPINSIESFKVYETIENITQSRTNKLIPHTIISTPKQSYKYHGEHDCFETISSNSALIFSILKKLNHLSSQEENQLSKVNEVQFTKMTSLSGKSKIISPIELHHLDQSHLSEQKYNLLKELENRILHSINKSEHKLCSCFSETGACPLCVPWLLLMKIFRLPRHDKRIYTTNWTELISIMLAFKRVAMSNYAVWSGMQNQLIITDVSTDPKQLSYLIIPENISLALFQIELNHIVKLVLKETNKFDPNSTIDSVQIIGIMEQALNRNYLKKFPIALSFKADRITLTVPSKYLNNPLL